MKSIKKVSLKIFLLVIVLCSCNWIYTKFFYEKDLLEHTYLRKEIKNTQEFDIVYFGESSNFTTRADDLDKRPISEIISSYFPNKKLTTVNKGALHAGIYKHLMRQIPENDTIETVIVTLNLRSFTADWIYSKLETALQKNVVLLSPYPPLFKRFLLSFKAYDIKTDVERSLQVKEIWKNTELIFPFDFEYSNVDEWDKALANGSWKLADGNWDLKKINLTCHYVKTYAFQIDTNSNPRIKDFDEIVEIAKERNWNLVFNLLAENTHKAEQLVGEELSFLMRQNRDLLVERYSNKGCIVVDNLESIPDEQFVDQNWTTEHYAEKGRNKIAKNVAEHLKEIYPYEYTYVEWHFTYPVEFYNNFDNDISWNQPQTLTKEKSFSTPYSSKINKSAPYSSTFEYPFTKIPFDNRSQIKISCDVFQTEISDDAKLVVEISGAEDKFWYGQSINVINPLINDWISIEHTINIPEKYKNGALVKIFVMNTNPNPVYVDNMKINFLKE